MKKKPENIEDVPVVTVSFDEKEDSIVVSKNGGIEDTKAKSDTKKSYDSEEIKDKFDEEFVPMPYQEVHLDRTEPSRDHINTSDLSSCWGIQVLAGNGQGGL
jgi:hypothetical protein